MTITIESLKAEYAQLGKKLASFEAQAAFVEEFPITITAPKLKLGEKWVSTVITDDGKTRYHLVLLPGDADDDTWTNQLAWARARGGDLPDRVEQAMLFKYARHEFNEQAYWSNQEHESDSSCAWHQTFYNGYQSSSHKGAELRARAVRRLVID